MHGEHASEDSGIGFQGAHDLLAEGSFPIECEHEARHQHGTPCQRAVLFRVGAEIACGEALGQDLSLAKGKAEAFAGDGIDGARSVAYQSDIVAIDLAQFAGGRDCAALRGGRRRVVQARSDFRECGERGIEAKMRIAGDESDANFVGGDGSNVNLAA